MTITTEALLELERLLSTIPGGEWSIGKQRGGVDVFADRFGGIATVREYADKLPELICVLRNMAPGLIARIRELELLAIDLDGRYRGEASSRQSLEDGHGITSANEVATELHHKLGERDDRIRDLENHFLKQTAIVSELEADNARWVARVKLLESRQEQACRVLSGKVELDNG